MQSVDPATPPRTDEALMLAYGGGDALAFETLYARHRGGTYRYFLRHARSDAATADELHQDLWLRVIASRDRYETRAKFTTWLYALARHRLIDHWRRHRPAGVAVPLDQDDSAWPDVADAADVGVVQAWSPDDPLRASMDAQTGQRLVAALQEIPAAQRDAFLLHVEAGLSLAEIADVTASPTETVKSRLRYAYRRLRGALEDLR